MSTIRCNNCGAPIEHDGKRDHIFCTYCGSQIDLTRGNDDHKEHIIQEYRNVDEARIKEADRDIAIKKMEYELETLRLQAQKKSEPNNIKILLIWIGFIILMVLMTAWGEKLHSDMEAICLIIILVLLAATPFVLWQVFRRKK